MRKLTSPKVKVKSVKFGISGQSSQYPAAKIGNWMDKKKKTTWAVSVFLFRLSVGSWSELEKDIRMCLS